ncbi:MAG: hypothetical protein AAF152_03020 [Cyanobacteria bacterium P01_A01_bin.114]
MNIWRVWLFKRQKNTPKRLLQDCLKAYRKEGFANQQFSLRLLEQMASVSPVSPGSASLKHTYFIHPEGLSCPDAFRQSALYILEYQNLLSNHSSGLLVLSRPGQLRRGCQISSVEDALEALKRLLGD